MNDRPIDPMLSVVIPVYNEAALIERFLFALMNQLADIGLRWQVVVVDDGSHDASASTALGAAGNGNVQVIRLSRNFGKEAALTAGLAQARGDAVVLIDADFQHPIDALPTFVARWREGYDMVFGVRVTSRREPLIKRLLRRLFHRIAGHEDGIELPEGAGDFRLLDRKVVDALACFPERARMMKGLYALLGFRQIGVPYNELPRAGGTTRFGTWMLMRLAVIGLASFSTMPLRQIGWIGLFVSMMAFAYAGWLGFEAVFIGQPIDGFATLGVGLMLFGGLQMLSIAALGTYVALIYREVKARPLYIVDTVQSASVSKTEPER